MLFYRKQGLPEEGELVMCKVTNIHFSSVFVNIKDYGNMSGHIHISEISPGRIRNIRDYVKEGKVVVCKVLRVNRERNQVDLSLRRVTEMQRRLKVNQLKQEQKAERMLSTVAEQLKMEPKALYDEVFPLVSKRYDLLYSCFEDFITNENVFKELGITPKIIKPLSDIVKQRIKPSQVKIGGKITLTSYDSNGVEVIKKALEKGAATNENISIFYVGGGSFNVSVTSSNYKDAEKILETATAAIIQDMEKNKGTAVFQREKAKG